MPISVKNLMILPELESYLSKQNYDLLHSQGVATWALASCKPAVLTIHGINELDTLFRGNKILAKIRSNVIRVTEGRQRSSVRNIIAINPYVKKFISKRHAGSVWDIPNPVSDTYFEVKRNAVQGRIAYIGTVMPRKNQMSFIRGFSRFAQRHLEAEVIFAGSGENSEYAIQCRRVASSLGLSERVKFVGSLSVGELQSLLSTCDFAALFSQQETAPLSISECMAAGVPFVSSGICGIPYMIKNYDTGIVASGNEDDDIASALEIIYSLDREKMSNSSREVAKNLYSSARVACETLHVYESILNK